MSKTTKIRQQTFTAPATAANTGVHAAITLPSSGTNVVDTAITIPAVPRTIRLKGNQASVQGLGVILAGTNIMDNAITVPTRGAASDTIGLDLHYVPAIFPAYNRIYG